MTDRECIEQAVEIMCRTMTDRRRAERFKDLVRLGGWTEESVRDRLRDKTSADDRTIEALIYDRLTRVYGMTMAYALRF